MDSEGQEWGNSEPLNTLHLQAKKMVSGLSTTKCHPETNKQTKPSLNTSIDSKETTGGHEINNIFVCF